MCQNIIAATEYRSETVDEPSFLVLNIYNKEDDSKTSIRLPVTLQTNEHRILNQRSFLTEIGILVCATIRVFDEEEEQDQDNLHCFLYRV